MTEATEIRTIEFWYDFASTYSYLAAERVDVLAGSRDIQVHWRPFMLGPIFQAQGWTGSPFNIYKDKGDYMWRDMERCAKLLGLPFKRYSHPFPQNSLLAARTALCLPDGEVRGAFTKKIYQAEFIEEKNIADPDTITVILKDIAQDAGQILAQTKSQLIKDKLFAYTAEAKSKKIFGAPSFITPDGELFWGHDRLEQALDWHRPDRDHQLRRGDKPGLGHS